MFKLRKTRQKLALSLTPLGAVRAAAQGLGIKIDVWENPIVYATTPDWSSLYGTLRVESETACSLMFLLALRVSLGALRLFLFYVHRCGCSEFYCDASGALKFVSPLSESSPSSREHQKKKKKVSVAARQSVHPRRTFANTFKFILPPLDSAFDRVKVNSNRPSARYHSCWRSWR